MYISLTLVSPKKIPAKFFKIWIFMNCIVKMLILAVNMCFKLYSYSVSSMKIYSITLSILPGLTHFLPRSRLCMYLLFWESTWWMLWLGTSGLESKWTLMIEKWESFTSSPLTDELCYLFLQKRYQTKKNSSLFTDLNVNRFII